MKVVGWNDWKNKGWWLWMNETIEDGYEWLKLCRMMVVNEWNYEGGWLWMNKNMKEDRCEWMIENMKDHGCE